jgi:hypothetical protein
MKNIAHYSFPHPLNRARIECLRRASLRGLAIASIAFVCLIISGCSKPTFAIYLVKGERGQADTHHGPDVVNAKLEEPPLLTERDITVYDWTTHSITLAPAGEKKLFQYRGKENLHPGAALATREFIVTAEGKRCYGGAFWLTILSKGYDHPVIDVYTPSSTIRIEQAFPRPERPGTPDLRADPRIKRALEKVGKIKEDT